jgi:Carboxypeptidase regulatory-like domain
MRRLGLLRSRPRMLMRSVFIIIILSLYFRSLPLNAEVDCVYPKLHLSSLYGLVVDPSGSPIPGAQVSLSRNGNDENKTTTDSMGRFSFKSISGQYEFQVTSTGFSKAWSRVDIGFDLRSLTHPNTLRVILGIGYDTCNILTTSNREFQKAIRANNKRVQEVEQ